MVERWMKERAAKSFGGPCMSKFVQENERKRILRLKNMKSSISRSASNKHDHWTQNQVDKRHREIRMKKVDDGTVGRTQDSSSNPDFDLCFHRDVDVTKSGLKLKLNTNATTTAKPKRSASFTRQNENEIVGNRKTKLENSKSEVGTDMDQKHTSLQTRDNRMRKNHEEKENQSPIGSEIVDAKVPKKSTSVCINKGPSTSICKTAKSLCRSEDRKATSKVVSNGRGTSKNNLKVEKKMKQKDQITQKVSLSISKTSATKQSTKGRALKSNLPTKHPNRRKENQSRSSIINEEGRKSSGKKYAVSNSKQQQLHANRGVTLESLSKEKEEALAMLREIDTKTSWKEENSDGPVSQEVVGETRQETKANDTTLEVPISEDFVSSENLMESNMIKSTLDNLAETCNVEIPYSPTIQGKDELDSSSRHENGIANSNDSILSRISSEDTSKISRSNSDERNGRQLSSEGGSFASYSENFESEMAYTDGEESSSVGQKREIELSDNDGRNKTLKEHNEIDESVDWTPQFKVESFFVHQS